MTDSELHDIRARALFTPEDLTREDVIRLMTEVAELKTRCARQAARLQAERDLYRSEVDRLVKQAADIMDEIMGVR